MNSILFEKLRSKLDKNLGAWEDSILCPESLTQNAVQKMQYLWFPIPNEVSMLFNALMYTFPFCRF